MVQFLYLNSHIYQSWTVSVIFHWIPCPSFHWISYNILIQLHDNWQSWRAAARRALPFGGLCYQRRLTRNDATSVPNSLFLDSPGRLQAFPFPTLPLATLHWSCQRWGVPGMETHDYFAGVCKPSRQCSIYGVEDTPRIHLSFEGGGSLPVRKK